MIDFSSETYRTILQRMLDRVPNTYDKRDTAPIPTALSPAAYELEGLYLTLSRMQDSAFPETAAGEDLDALAILGGVTRQAATRAVRLGVFNIPVPLNARFSTPDAAGIVFYVSKATENELQYQLTAETAGTAGNTYVGNILPITAIQGLTEAYITDILIPGEDTETDETLRERFIERLKEKPFAGNIAAYKENILSIAGVGAVQVYPTWDGGGTVKCSILDARLLPASTALVNEVQEKIDPVPVQGQGLGLAPIGAIVTITTATELTINIEANITVSTGYTLQQLQTLIEQAIENYFAELRGQWSKPYVTGAQYALTVYLSRILAAIVGVQGVANASDILLNGSESDIILQEDAQLQQIPILGTVVLHEL